MLKRAVDILAGSILAALTLPFVLLFAVGSAISLRAWPFFVQQRVGKDGKPFPLPKLRTLPASAPPAIDKYALQGTHIPAFCRLLRRTHLDELPQLLIVPVGWMSLVGPRPEMPNLIERYPSDFAATRSTVRPGCTGLWQISSSSGKLIYEAPEYDVVYTQHHGLRLDAWIAYRTLRLLSTGRAAIDLSDLPHWAFRRGQLTSIHPAESVDAAGRATGDAVVVDLRDHATDDAIVIDLRDHATDDSVVIDLREINADSDIVGFVDERPEGVIVELRAEPCELRPEQAHVQTQPDGL
jgi:lipopolysaccharide/colanic/teichoic acid biosynthesis glycosyltransferase